MPPITIVDNEYITVEYWPTKKIVLQAAHKPVSGQILRDAVYAGTETLKTYGACKWLSDDRKNGPLSNEEMAWGIEWIHRSIEVGWKYWANVVPEQLAAAGSLLPMIDFCYGLGLRMMVFTDVEKATEWLDRLEN